MKRKVIKYHGTSVILALLFLFAASASANAVIPGISNATSTFSLVTGSAHVGTPDGDTVLIWAYGDGSNPVQYPGPTLIVNQGDTVTINLTNNLAGHGNAGA